MVRGLKLALITAAAVLFALLPAGRASDAELDRDLITFGEYAPAPAPAVTDSDPAAAVYPVPGGLEDLVPIAPPPARHAAAEDPSLDELVDLAAPSPSSLAAAPESASDEAVGATGDLADLVDISRHAAEPVQPPVREVVAAIADAPVFADPFRPTPVSPPAAPPPLPVLEPAVPPDAGSNAALLAELPDEAADEAGGAVQDALAALPILSSPPPPEPEPPQRGGAVVIALDQLQDLVLDSADPDLTAMDDDLVPLATPSPTPPAAFEPSPLEILAGPPQLAGVDIARARAGFDRLEAHCLAGEVALARTEYDALPAFGPDGTVNRIRSDAANLLVLNYGMDGDLDSARAIFDALPASIPGEGAMLGRQRAILNLATFYVRGERLDDGYAMFAALPPSGPEPELHAEAFRLAARMIPYFDNAGDADKAEAVYDRMLEFAGAPGALPHFCRHMPGLTKYLLGRPSVVVSTPEQERRLSFMERIFESFGGLPPSRERERLRRETAEAMEHFYRVTGNTPKATEMREFLASREAPGRRSAPGQRLE